MKNIHILPTEELNYNGKLEIEWISKNLQCKQIESCYNSLSKKCICPKEEPKKQTLEDYLDSQTLIVGGYPATELVLNMFKNGARLGANWQKEQMYSEQEVLDIVNKTVDRFCTFFSDDLKQKASKEWFEQFKKK